MGASRGSLQEILKQNFSIPDPKKALDKDKQASAVSS